MRSIWDGLIHFRPSGIRVKRATYVPALVAITQTTIVGPLKRRITPSEAALLQGLPKDFTFLNQKDSLSYKQLGNGVAVGVVYQVVKAAAIRDEEILKVTNPKLLSSILQAPKAPGWIANKEKKRTKKLIS
jgi:DNA (cytosine-5)-methyltransferase 1